MLPAAGTCSAGSVSSKSLMSKTSLRWGVAKAPKFIRWQSPQACTRRPIAGVRERSKWHHGSGTAQKGEHRGQHPRVANWHQLRDPMPVRFDHDLNRVAPPSSRGPTGVLLSGTRARSAFPASYRRSTGT